MTCPFCTIIAGTTPATIIGTTGTAIAFLDHAPYARGHTLIVPREHYPDFLRIPSASLGELFHLAQRLGRAVLTGLNADGFHLGLNNGRAARQVVFHAHIHLIPRWAGDRMDFRRRIRYREGEEEGVGEILGRVLEGIG